MALLDVDDARETFAWHCAGCGTVRRGLSLAKGDLIVTRHPSGLPHMHALTTVCGSCGTGEVFNCDLGPEDEVEREGNHAFRAGQARLIRRLMKHPRVALETREHAKPPTPRHDPPPA